MKVRLCLTRKKSTRSVFGKGGWYDFSELFGIFDRYAKSQSQQIQAVANRRRVMRTF